MYRDDGSDSLVIYEVILHRHSFCSSFHSQCGGAGMQRGVGEALRGVIVIYDVMIPHELPVHICDHTPSCA